MDYDQHIETITELSKPGQALAADAPTATINNPEWFRRSGETRAARGLLHARLLEAARRESPSVEQERKAIVLAGPPGAGKSTVLKSVLGRDEDKYLVIDADKFKAALLEQARQDGSLESTIKPEVLKERERTTGERFYPMELASLVHEESSILAVNMREDAIARGDNIVVDTVLSSETKAVQLGERLSAAGYDVEVVDVEVPFEVSQERIRSRWQQAYEEAEQTESGLGGRWVPSEYARDVFDGPEGKTKPEHAAQKLAENCPAVTRYRVYRTTAEQAQQPKATPTLETDKARPNRGAAELVDTSQLQTRNRLHTAQSPTARSPRPGPSKGRER